MKRWFFVVVVMLGTACSGYAQSASVGTGNRIFRHPQANYSFSYPSDWGLTKVTGSVSVTVVHPNALATLNITVLPVYTSTASELQKNRAMTLYDGWMNLFEREGTVSENKRVGASNSAVAVYAKQSLRADLSIQKNIVGEYCYVQHMRAYILRVQADQDSWIRIQSVIRNVIDSFRVPQ